MQSCSSISGVIPAFLLTNLQRTLTGKCLMLLLWKLNYWVSNQRNWNSTLHFQLWWVCVLCLCHDHTDWHTKGWQKENKKWHRLQAWIQQFWSTGPGQKIASSAVRAMSPIFTHLHACGSAGMEDFLCGCYHWKQAFPDLTTKQTGAASTLITALVWTHTARPFFMSWRHCSVKRKMRFSVTCCRHQQIRSVWSWNQLLLDGGSVVAQFCQDREGHSSSFLRTRQNGPGAFVWVVLSSLIWILDCKRQSHHVLSQRVTGTDTDLCWQIELPPSNF